LAFFILFWIPAHVPLRFTGRDDDGKQSGGLYRLSNNL